MKKIVILFLSILAISGCAKEEKIEVKYEKIKKVDSYKDINTTPIGIYKLEGNTLTRLKSIDKKLKVEEDIGLFQIYPSKEEKVELNTSFGEAFYKEWSKYKDIKQGFNIKYSLNNAEISYNILSPNETFNHWEYLMNYLYDDYINKDKSFYSHLEANEFKNTTLLTSFKMQAGYKCSEIKKIELTAFTYDSKDDLFADGYRGNSKATLVINIK